MINIRRRELMTDLKSRSLIIRTSLLLLISSILFDTEAKQQDTRVQISSKSSSKIERSHVVNIFCLPESSIKIDGDSSVRKYSAVASLFDLRGKAKENQSSSSNLPWTPIEIEMSLATENLKSGERTLDKHMHENLKMQKYPMIRMKLSTFSFAERVNDASSSVKASGTLAVAGVTKPIELNSTITTENSNIRIKGKKRLLMSEFGIQPPTLMMGTMKTHDEIDVSYDVVCSIDNQQMTGK